MSELTLEQRYCQAIICIECPQVDLDVSGTTNRYETLDLTEEKQEVQMVCFRTPW